MAKLIGPALTKELEDVQEGTITGFRRSWANGIATLLVDGRAIYCDNAPTVRALDACFGCIADGHTIDVSLLIGQQIAYQVDDLGMLTSFAPIGDDETC